MHWSHYRRGRWGCAVLDTRLILVTECVYHCIIVLIQLVWLQYEIYQLFYVFMSCLCFVLRALQTNHAEEAHSIQVVNRDQCWRHSGWRQLQQHAWTCVRAVAICVRLPSPRALQRKIYIRKISAKKNHSYVHFADCCIASYVWTW